MYGLPFSWLPNIGEIRVNIVPKANYIFHFLSACTNRNLVFDNFFSLKCTKRRPTQNCVHNFLLFKYFLNNSDFFHKTYAFKTHRSIKAKNN